jgi:hypothetical protein
MRRRVAVAVAVLVAVACAERPDPTAPLTLAVLGDAAAHSENANGGNFGTQLSPDDEVMPTGIVNTSKAVGNAIFHLSADRQTLSYKLIVANIKNVFQAHIHRGAPGTNGPIVVWLYPSTDDVAGPTNEGRIQGVIAQGTITKADFVGTLAGAEMSALLDLITGNTAYVNAHTSDGVNPRDTGPGDYPGGEIRGPIGHRGH